MSNRWTCYHFSWLYLFGFSFFVVGCSAREPIAQRSDKIRAIPVKTVAVATAEVQRTTAQPATVYAYHRAEIRAKVTGFVKELKADIGDYVAAGETLALIDVPEMRKQREVIEARIRKLEAEERRSESNINLAAARVSSSQAKLAEANSQMNRADASLAAAEAEFNRTQDMVQRQSLQSRILDEVRKKRDSELANREAVESAIDSAQADIIVAQAQFASAEADLQAAQAETDISRRQLEELDVLIDYATLKAPFAGVVTHRSIEPGDLVRELNEVGKGSPLFVISQVDRVRVRIPVPESDAPRVNRGDQVSLVFPSFAGEAPVTGTVTRMAGGLDPSTRTMLVEADIENPGGKLLPGMFGQATLNLSTKVAANVLPSRAIRYLDGGKAYVYVVGQDDMVSVSPIVTGMDDGNSIEVLSGVEAGQRVIDAHLKRFSDGQKVTVLAN